MSVAIAFLCKIPHPDTISFADKVAIETGFRVFVVVDSMVKIEPTRNCSIIQLDDTLTLASGYKNCEIGTGITSVGKNPTAWDKFCWYFAQLDTAYDNVWVFEDDVYIPSSQTLINLCLKYNKYDLVTANNFQRVNGDMAWYWPHIINKIEGPHYHSMMCGAGMSRAMLEKINERVQQKGELLYLEALFNTIATNSGLKVHNPFELKSIVWWGEWDINALLLFPDNVFHPIKPVERHQELRLLTQRAIDEKVVPVNNLPSFITDLMDKLNEK